MIIGIDGNEANVREKVGVSVYTLRHLEYFRKKANADLKFLVYLKRAPNDDLPKPKRFFSYKVVHGNFFWSQVFLPFRLLVHKIVGRSNDVFFSPAHYAPRYVFSPLVVTIHDLSYFFYPEEFLKQDLFKLKHWTSYSLKKARKIVAVSKTTKKDIVKFYDIPENKIEVIYNGFEKKIDSQNLKKNNAVKNLKLKIGNYILYVGTLQPRKNIPSLIQAFQRFHQQYPSFKLVIAGKKGWMYDEIFAKVKELGYQEHIIFAGFVSDGELADLYRHAFCFVMPSLYEGFGIPVLEAMSFGCPVISSFSSSLPEVGGESCLYFDPKDPSDLYQKLIMLKENHALRMKMIQRGKKRVKFFSWEQCTEKTLEVLKYTSYEG